MSAVLIVALLVAVITLGALVVSQSKTISKYEDNLRTQKESQKGKK